MQGGLKTVRAPQNSENERAVDYAKIYDDDHDVSCLNGFNLNEE